MQQPDQNQAEEAEEATEVVKDFDTLFQAVRQWHLIKMREVVNMSRVPDDTNITIEINDVKHTMTGEFREGFIQGVESAMILFGQFPFHALPDSNSNDTPEASSAESSGDGPKPT